MNIIFQWNGNKLSAEQKMKVEEDIRHEMPDAIKQPGPIGDLVVSLFSDPLLSSLAGVVESISGEPLVKITYSLEHPCRRSYFPLGHSCSDEP